MNSSCNYCYLFVLIYMKMIGSIYYYFLTAVIFTIKDFTHCKNDSFSQLSFLSIIIVF